MGDLPFDFPSSESRYVSQTRKAASALRRRFGTGVPATDMVHDVLLDALAEQSQAGSEATGFWRRLVNKAYDNYRRQRAHRRMVGRRLDELQGPRTTAAARGCAEEEAIGRELRAAIELAAAELSPTDQDIWQRLRSSESYIEIARALGKSTPAVRQAAWRIRAHVRDRLPPEYRRNANGDGR